MARPLIESLKHEATIRGDSLRKIIPFKLKTFEEAIELARKKEKRQKNSVTQRKEHVTHSDNNKILLLSLVLLAAIGITYYIMGVRPELLSISWLARWIIALNNNINLLNQYTVNHYKTYVIITSWDCLHKHKYEIQDQIDYRR